MALCSLSTGSSIFPLARACAVTRLPPATSASLVARATSLPAPRLTGILHRHSLRMETRGLRGQHVHVTPRAQPDDLHVLQVLDDLEGRSADRPGGAEQDQPPAPRRSQPA